MSGVFQMIKSTRLSLMLHFVNKVLYIATPHIGFYHIILLSKKSGLIIGIRYTCCAMLFAMTLHFDEFSRIVSRFIEVF